MSNSKHKQQGIAAIEFLWSLPVLLLIMAGIFDFGQAFIDYTVLNKAVHGGARYAVRGVSNTADSIADESEIKNMVVYGNTSGTGSAKLDTLTPASVTVAESGNYVTVTGVYQYIPFFSPLPFTTISLNIPLTTSMAMRSKP